jgi:glucose-1-phosphate thymidylyltransferase
MVQVDGEPLIEHTFEYALEAGVDKPNAVVGYLKEKVISAYGESPEGVPTEYTTQETQDGLAHATAQVDDTFDENFLLLLADVLYGDFPSEKVSSDELSLITDTVPYDEASEYGVCVTTDEGRIKTLIEKPDSPPTNHILAGGYVLPPRIHTYCRLIEPSDRGEYEITDAINALLAMEGIDATLVHTDGWRVDVARDEDIDQAESLLSDKNELKDPVPV